MTPSLEHHQYETTIQHRAAELENRVVFDDFSL